MRTRNTVTAILMFVLVLSFTIGGTLAWLTDTTEPVTCLLYTSPVFKCTAFKNDCKTTVRFRPRFLPKSQHIKRFLL